MPLEGQGQLQGQGQGQRQTQFQSLGRVQLQSRGEHDHAHRTDGSPVLGLLPERGHLPPLTRPRRRPPPCPA